MDISSNVLEAIGKTRLVELRRVVPEGCARISVKVEGANPTGSMKDRMAQAMIARAEADGRLNPGDTVVEYTGGSTGAALALVSRGLRRWSALVVGWCADSVVRAWGGRDRGAGCPGVGVLCAP